MSGNIFGSLTGETKGLHKTTPLGCGTGTRIKLFFVKEDLRTAVVPLDIRSLSASIYLGVRFLSDRYIDVGFTK